MSLEDALQGSLVPSPSLSLRLSLPEPSVTPPKGQGEPHLNYSPTSSASFSISALLDRGPLLALNLFHYALSSAYPFLSSTQSVLSPSHVSALLDTYSFDFTSHSLAYKPVAKKVWPVLAPLEEEYRVLCQLPDDPLAGLKTLPTNPPDFVPRQRFTQERTDALDLDPAQ